MTEEVDLKHEQEPAGAGSDVERLFFRDPETAVAAGGESPAKATKAEPVAISPTMSVAQAFEAIALACIRHFRSNEPLVAKQRDVSALHQMRVSMRRLRAALSLFRPALADPQFDNIRHELRWFTGQLGGARNLDVFLQQRGLPLTLRKSIKAERERAYDDVVEALESRRLRLLLIDLVAWVELGRWRQNHKAMRPLQDFVARRLYKWWQKIAHHGDLGPMHGHERHDLRIEIKKLRYSIEFVQPLHVRAGRKQKQFHKAVERMQESLGRLNDLATMQAISRTFGRKNALPKSEIRKVETSCLHAAQASLDRIKEIGPYWTKLA